MKKVYDAEQQFLTVALAKGIGLSPGGVVHALDDVESLSEAGLRPLLVVSLVAPAYCSYLRTLVDPSNPVAISGFLQNAWSSEMEFGMPLSLSIKESLLAADRGFAAWVRAQGIEIVLPANTKSINAFERTSRDVSHPATWCPDAGVSPKDYPRSLQDCNEGLLYHDRFIIGSALHIQYSMDQHTYMAWRRRELRYCLGAPVADDWDASVIQRKESARPRTGFAVARSDDVDTLQVDGIKDLVAMWPGGSAAFFKGLSVTKRDFDFWASGRAHLTEEEIREVFTRAGVRYDEEIDDFQLSSGYLLQATTKGNVSALYTELSHGGDIEWAFEVRGPSGEIPPMRIAVFGHCGGLPNILLFERGSKAETVLDSRALINFGHPIMVPSEVWEDVLSIIASKDTYLDPTSVGEVFFMRHGAWLQSISRPLW